VDLELRSLLQAQEQVESRAMSGLLVMMRRQAFAAGQPLQHRPRDAEPELGGLIGIGRGADDDAFAKRDALEVGVECTTLCSLTKIAAS